MSESPLSIWGLGMAEMEETFSADRIVGAILHFEAALALSLADAGIAPVAEAQSVASACEVTVGDAGGLLATTWEAGTPMLAIIELIAARLESDQQRRWVHHGSTTQDAIDTAHVLLIKEAIALLEIGFVELARTMSDLALEHRDQPQMGRTFLQNALPTTFGLRVGGWLDPALTHLERLRATRAGLTLQFGGPVGNLAGLGDDGSAVASALATRLELAVPDVPWHTDRTRIREVVNVVDDAVASLAKVASDVALLAQSGIGEVTTRSGGSSSIPHKKNPIDSVRALAAADVCHGAAAIVRGGRPHELDRSLGSWQAEWAAMPLLFSSASGVVEATNTLLASLEVNASAMDWRAGETPTPPNTDLIDTVLARYHRLVGD